MDPQSLGTLGMIQYLWAHWSEIQNAWAGVMTALTSLLGTLVFFASLITPFTRTVADDKLVDKLKGFIHQVSVTNPKK